MAAPIIPEAVLEYYTDMVRRMGQNTVDDFVRLYIVPGMGHCGAVRCRTISVNG
jgi:feruloyl esterase